MCGIAVPVPARSDGRPGSVTLLAKAGQDDRIAVMALHLEAAGTRALGATSWPFVAPPTTAAAQSAPVLRLAVCGAHMSGLPLNRQLTDRGAVFVKAARTTDAYRFYTLAGGPPARPGLVRGVPGSGEPIALELWDVPLAKIGSFLAGISAPLGLGTIALNDGTTVQGFMCEAVATQNATDITAIGDWRKWLCQVA